MMIKVEMKDGEIKVFDGVTFNVEEGFMMMWDNENVIGAVKSEEIRSISIEEEKEPVFMTAIDVENFIEERNQKLIDSLYYAKKRTTQQSREMPKIFNVDYMRGYSDMENEARELIEMKQKEEVKV